MKQSCLQLHPFASLPYTLKCYLLPVDEFDSILYEINFLAKDTKDRMKDKFEAQHKRAVHVCGVKRGSAPSGRTHAVGRDRGGRTVHNKPA